MKLTNFLLFLLFAHSAVASPIPNHKSQFLTVKAKHGDGAYSLLRHYKLLTDPNNLNRFYRLNKIKANTPLLTGKSYKLPIKIHQYDGKSLQSSLKNQDAAWIHSIEQYNRDLVSSAVRKVGYKNSKQILVPETDPGILKQSIKRDQDDVALRTNESNLPDSKSKNETDAKSSDNRKQFLLAGVGSTAKSERLVAERKLTSSEVIALNSANVSEKSSMVGSAIRVSSKSFKVPLFGQLYEKVDLKSENLKKQVFYIVPGHGGPDPGAMAKNVEGKYTICEDEYAYDVSLRLAKNLMENGAMVYVIVEDKNDGIRDEQFLDCDTDETIFGGSKISASQKKRLKQGISKVNKLYKKHKKQGYSDQWMVSLHIDAQSEENRQDVFFYYQSESEKSKNKAIDIQNIFEDKYQVYRKDREYNGTVSARPLYVVRNSDPEPIFIELANIHNEEDRKRILFPRNRQLLADWITQGFIDQ